MNPLIVSDLHLNDNPRDEYRWQLFPFLQKQVRKRSVDALFILGDITDEKDRHSARLVNRVVDALHMEGPGNGPLDIWLLMGNHDNIDPSLPFFQFVNRLPHVRFITTPFLADFGLDAKVLLLPHTRNALEEWGRIEFMHEADIVLMHGTVKGAKAENGQALDGIPAGALASVSKRARIYSGDVHVPQKVGRVEYVGAPYPVRFGDSFKGRALLFKGWEKPEDIVVPSIRRAVIYATPNGVDHPPDLAQGDQVKVRIRLSASEMGDWTKVKSAALQWCAFMGVEVCAVELERQQSKEVVPKIARALRRSPGEIFAEYCAKAKVEKELVAVGKHILGSISQEGSGNG